VVSFIFYILQHLTVKLTAQVDRTYLNIADHIELPVNNPVLIFAIILFIILISPVILKKFRVSGIVSFLAGKTGFSLLNSNNNINLVGISL